MSAKLVLEIQKWMRDRPTKHGVRRKWPVIVQNKKSASIRVISTVRKGLVNFNV